MFSRLDPVFRTTFRQTEQTDTRLGIRQEDNKDDPRKGRTRDEGDDEDEAREDRAMVSVSALRAFLAGMLQNADGATGPGSTPATAQTSRAAQAARAYQTTATGTGPAAYPAAAGGGETAGELTEQEKSTISGLIETLAWLEKRDVLELAIGRTSESLLAGLVDAANRAKADLGG